MDLILTHENADFDAVASQLAAHKLYPEAVPLLSWRVNRNVEGFLRLFWDAFDFARPKDWKRQRVDKVVLVDTETLPSIRGVKPEKVEVQVIDHHVPVKDRPASWTFHVELVGATTTLLVEMLESAGLSLTPSEATLLLLGIHEDTGSLVYDTTTDRDVRAVAWLMGQGAQLGMLRRFLNIPLSKSQLELSQTIQESISWIAIEGQNVACAAVEAPLDFEDEISAVAHWVRDALTPDAMVLLVQLKYNHVQMVARSSTDYVDVAVIAKALGGGGHSRAAAATVMDRPLAEVQREVLELLPSAVQPMLSVSQIMSFGVQTIFAEETVAQAAERMRRQGHEGYPVIDEGSGLLVGLLTRRSVDRAVSHGLDDLPISEVMKAGRITVHPSESVDKVQQLMIREGWGQIPVLGEDSGPDESDNLLGIVTRTDIINLQSGLDRHALYPEMRQMMAQSLPPAIWQLILKAGETAKASGMSLYFVGGIVRDLILDLPPQDVDLVVEGDAIALVRRLRSIFGGEIRSHSQFGTAKWFLSKQAWAKVAGEDLPDTLPDSIDFVTARTEFYTEPSALPEVARGSIKLDLHRRDFTINTLAVRLDGAHLGELLDFYGGLRDLDVGIIRVLHSLSFVDDPTRILRAVRLEQRLGFHIEERTAELLASALPMLNRVTGDRVRNEFEMCLRASTRSATMSRLNELHVLKAIHPDLIWNTEIAESFARGERILDDPGWRLALGSESPVFLYFALLLARLPARVQRKIMARLRVRKSTREDVLEVGQMIGGLTSLSEQAMPSEVSKVLRYYRDRVLLVGLALLSPDTPSGRGIDQFYRHWRKVRTSFNGDDLLAMGLKPGPDIGRLLDMLWSARLDGKIADRGDEEALLKEHLADSDGRAN